MQLLFKSIMKKRRNMQLCCFFIVAYLITFALHGVCVCVSVYFDYNLVSFAFSPESFLKSISYEGVQLEINSANFSLFVNVFILPSFRKKYYFIGLRSCLTGCFFLSVV